MNKRGLTLLELLIVVIIIGVLATLATVSYTGIKEDTVDKEAKANLRLIFAAQRIYRMELSRYFPYTYGTNSNKDEINKYLRLLLPIADNRNWIYSATSDATGACCGQATRNIAGGKSWKMLNSADPVVGTCP